MLKKKKKFFSIIVVSLNTKNKFIKTFNSIVNQKFRNYEIIVVDGGSKDGTIDEINKRKDKINRSIIEKDKGIYYAMNKGIKYVKGSWVIFLNSGDKFYDSRTLYRINKKNLKNYEVIYGDAMISNNSFKYIQRSNTFKNKTFFMPFCHQSVFTKKNLFNNKKFDTKYKLASDFEFFYYQFKKKRNFFKINEIISEVEAKGISDTNRSLVFKEYKKIYNKYNINNAIIPIYFLSNLYYRVGQLLKIFLGKRLTEYILKVKYSQLK